MPLEKLFFTAAVLLCAVIIIKTNVRILRIYKNKNSTQYIIIIYVAESAETLTRPQSLSQPVPSCAQGAMGRKKMRECLSLLTFH